MDVNNTVVSFDHGTMVATGKSNVIIDLFTCYYFSKHFMGMNQALLGKT